MGQGSTASLMVSWPKGVQALVPLLATGPTQCEHASVQNPACRLITGSAALLVCGAASALLKLQQDTRAGEQRKSTAGSRLVCKQPLFASATCKPAMQPC